MSAFDIFLGFGRHCGQTSTVSCPGCGVIWHFNTVKDARVFAQTHANECGSADLAGSVCAHFDCAGGAAAAPEAWGAPDVIAAEMREWAAMADMTANPQWKAARNRMVERARCSLGLAAEKIERHDPTLKVCREFGWVSPR
jgi:hypothetical protein